MASPSRRELHEWFVARSHDVRRHRALVVRATTVVAVLLVAGVVLDGNRLTSAPPPSPSPTPVVSPTTALGELPQGRPPEIDHVVGEQAHLDGTDVALPDGWSTHALVRAGDGWFVLASTPEGRFVARLAADGTVKVLDRHDPAGLAADPLGRRIAWGSAQRDAPGIERLTAYDVQEQRFVRRPVDQPVLVQGWAKEGVIASYAVDPGGSPFVWNPGTGTVTAVWGEAGGGPSFVAYSLAGHLWVLYDGLSGCNVVVDRLGGKAPLRGCTMSLGRPAAFVEQGTLLAATSGATVRIVDRVLADTGDRHPMPAGSSPSQIVPEGDGRRLVVVDDDQDGSPHVLRCVVSGSCERAVDGRPGETIALVSNP